MSFALEMSCHWSVFVVDFFANVTKCAVESFMEFLVSFAYILLFAFFACDEINYVSGFTCYKLSDIVYSVCDCGFDRCGVCGVFARLTSFVTAFEEAWFFGVSRFKSGSHKGVPYVLGTAVGDNGNFRYGFFTSFRTV